MRFAWNEKLGDPECPYMHRWVLPLGPLGSLRLHHWLRSDDKRYKHDHPADFLTIVLKGSYIDMGKPIINGKPSLRNTWEHMRPGTIRWRKAEHTHTVSVLPGGCWTLCYFRPDRRRWGFWVPRKSDGTLKWTKSNKFFLEHGHHPCDQP